MSKKITVSGLNLIVHKEGEGLDSSDLYVRIRHGGELVKVVSIEWIPAFAGMTGVALGLEREVFGVASGQSAVFYTEAGLCLGGGVIV
jgi:tRNA U34 2-thiouridine synthase MnmA/TrmU